MGNSTVSPNTIPNQSSEGFESELFHKKDMSYFTQSELVLLKKQYNNIAPKGTSVSYIDGLNSIAKRVGIQTRDLEVHFSNLGLNECDVIGFDEFIDAAVSIKGSKGQIPNASQDDRKIRLHGYKEDTMHTIDQDETISFTEHVNEALSKDEDLYSIIPIDPHSEDLVSSCSDGVLLAKLINYTSPGTIDVRALNISNDLSRFQMYENNNIVINTCKALGISVVNIGAEDILEGKAHLVLGLLWQIIKLDLQSNIALTKHPELYRLLREGETLESFLGQTPEENLVRWINHHIKDTPVGPITNISVDLRDGRVYTHLLNKLAPDKCDLSPLSMENDEERAEAVLKNAEAIGCRRYITPTSIINSNPKLTFAFLANLFDNYPGLESLDKDTLTELDNKLFMFERNIDREARSFLLWLNTLVDTDPYLTSFDGLLNGVVLLSAFDKVYSGIVDWKRVNTPNPKISRFCELENTNYVVYLGKSTGLSLVSIQGSDITEGSPMALKSIIWQLMRAHVLRTLSTLSNTGEAISDTDIIKWANEKVGKSGGRASISSFRDPSISNSHFLIQLLSAISPGSVAKDVVRPGNNSEDLKLNAQYAVSVARKLGATIFALPEDIIEVKPRMILKFVGGLMVIDKVKPKI